MNRFDMMGWPNAVCRRVPTSARYVFPKGRVMGVRL